MSKYAFIVAIVGALALAGCATKTNQSITELQRPSGEARILLMPLNVELYELSAGGVQEPKGEWTDEANRYMVAALRSERDTRKIRMVDYTEDRIAPDRRDDINQLVKLHGAVGQAILTHLYTPHMDLPTKQGRFEWSLGPSAVALKRTFDADYALFVFVRDSYSSAGRVAVQIAMAVLFGASVPGGQQLGFASLVDLNTGNIVWFNRLLRGTGDLRTQEAANETVQTLLAGLPQ